MEDLGTFASIPILKSEIGKLSGNDLGIQSLLYILCNFEILHPLGQLGGGGLMCLILRGPGPGVGDF